MEQTKTKISHKSVIENGPPVSVIICAYNAESFLHDCIKSILEQTYTNFELLIIDDASTDNTPQIINNAVKKDPRIRNIRFDKNHGVARARQKGIEIAKHNWVQFIDADDIVLPEMIAFQVEALQEDPDLIAVGTYSYYIGEDEGRVIGVQAIGPVSKEEFFHLYKNNKMLFLLLNTLFSKIHAFEKGGYRLDGFPDNVGVRLQDLSEDVDLWCRLSDFGAQGKYLKVLPKPLFYYRKRSDSISTKNAFYMQKKMRWIKDCLKRRRSVLKERSYEEYQNSVSLCLRLKYLCADYAAYFYKIMALNYIKKNYLHVITLLPLVFLLNPKYLFEKYKTQKPCKKYNDANQIQS